MSSTFSIEIALQKFVFCSSTWWDLLYKTIYKLVTSCLRIEFPNLAFQNDNKNRPQCKNTNLIIFIMNSLWKPLFYCNIKPNIEHSAVLINCP